MSTKNGSFQEKGIEIKGAVTLKGTFTIPDGEFQKYPAVLIVSGAGDIDRDGTISALNIKTNIYKDLAEMITNLGFVTLRYDKRGVGKSSGELIGTGMWDLVADVERGIDFLNDQPQVDRNNIILLGHSEGCTLITAAYQRKKAQGIIFLSGAAEPLEEATKRQRKIMYDQLMNAKGARGLISRLKKIDKKGEKAAQKLRDQVVNTDQDTIKFNREIVNAKWLREHYLYQLKDDLRNISCPIFAATGIKDFQADPERLKDLPGMVKGETEVHQIEDMDHSLKEYLGPIDALNFQQHYQDNVDKPLHKDLQRYLSDWLIKNYK